MTIQRVAFALGVLAMPMVAFGQAIDVNLSDTSAEVEFKNPLGLNAFKRAYYDIGFLYKDDKKNNTMGQVGFEVSGPAGSNVVGLDVGAGAKAYLASIADYDVVAVTLGLMARYAPPTANRFAMTFRANYAPDITTFNDGDNFFVRSARFGYEILPDVEIYTGYRKITAGIENRPDAKMVEGWHVGIEWTLP